ncbi:hypothetical protein [Cellulomonas uda]|uniref:Resolvase HTH domain-containing protein n=1 Tax=Cellulomonas uda TaxID=1714 RepID=A0A4Y3KEZ4_CELUD|nr:hypothetical protein [Cellulomonas uda]NII66885.1 DNA invertase Pin-like site-specific DNA recombinase [Cellulomonas uda]GEA82236.1 hypothetical protein CUD01_26800 [Cellulomonas uda]
MDLLQRYSNPDPRQMSVILGVRVATEVKAPDGNPNTRMPRRRASKLPEELIAALNEAYLAGDSTYVLARRFGIHRQTVARHLERAGIERREGNSSVVRH